MQAGEGHRGDDRASNDTGSRAVGGEEDLRNWSAGGGGRVRPNFGRRGPRMDGGSGSQVRGNRRRGVRRAVHRPGGRGAGRQGSRAAGRSAGRGAGGCGSPRLQDLADRRSAPGPGRGRKRCRRLRPGRDGRRVGGRSPVRGLRRVAERGPGRVGGRVRARVRCLGRRLRRPGPGAGLLGRLPAQRPSPPAARRRRPVLSCAADGRMPAPPGLAGSRAGPTCHGVSLRGRLVAPCRTRAR